MFGAKRKTLDQLDGIITSTEQDGTMTIIGVQNELEKMLGRGRFLRILFDPTLFGLYGDLREYHDSIAHALKNNDGATRCDNTVGARIHLQQIRERKYH